MNLYFKCWVRLWSYLSQQRLCPTRIKDFVETKNRSRKNIICLNFWELFTSKCFEDRLNFTFTLPILTYDSWFQDSNGNIFLFNFDKGQTLSLTKFLCKWFFHNIVTALQEGRDKLEEVNCPSLFYYFRIVKNFNIFGLLKIWNTTKRSISIAAKTDLVSFHFSPALNFCTFVKKSRLKG